MVSGCHEFNVTESENLQTKLLLNYDVLKEKMEHLSHGTSVFQSPCFTSNPAASGG